MYLTLHFRLSLLTLRLHDQSCNMSAQEVHHDESVAVPTVEKQNDTELSLESALDYKTWKPDRKEKMALAVQTLCVVRPARCPLYKEPADIVAQFIVSIDMTILTPTLPVGSLRNQSGNLNADYVTRPSLGHSMPLPLSPSG